MKNENLPKKHIFTDEFKQRLTEFTDHVSNDFEGHTSYAALAMAILTGILLFWWQIIGQLGVAAYVSFWETTYPSISIHESFTYNFIIGMNLLTKITILVIWVWLFCLVFVMWLKELNRRHPVTKKPSAVTHEPGIKTCKFCGSNKIRKAGKHTPGKMYCMSCRSYSP